MSPTGQSHMVIQHPLTMISLDILSNNALLPRLKDIASHAPTKWQKKICVIKICDLNFCFPFSAINECFHKHSISHLIISGANVSKNSIYNYILDKKKCPLAMNI